MSWGFVLSCGFSVLVLLVMGYLPLAALVRYRTCREKFHERQKAKPGEPEEAQPKKPKENPPNIYPDQTRRHHHLEDEVAGNFWRVALILSVLILDGVVALGLHHEPSTKIHLVRGGITVLFEAVAFGCALLVASETFRQHQNSGTSVTWEEAETKGEPEFTPWFYHVWRRKLLTVYYGASGLGLLLLTVSVWF